MRVMKFMTVAVVLAMLFMTAIAQPANPGQNAPAVKHLPIKNTPPDDGKAMYDNYCAVCHGKDGKGTGPAAPAMKGSPTDLTSLAKNHSGGLLPTAARTCQFGDRCSRASAKAVRPRCSNGLRIWSITSRLMQAK